MQLLSQNKNKLPNNINMSRELSMSIHNQAINYEILKCKIIIQTKF